MAVSGKKKDPQEGGKDFPQERAALLIKAIFEKLPRKVELLLFTRPKINEPYCRAAREMIRVVRKLTDKIGLRQFDLGHKLAGKYQVENSPTILFDPAHYKIRWLGAPIGEESAIFVEALVMLSHQKTHLSQQALKILKSFSEPRRIKIFISPTCPYCPHQIMNGLMAAVENPELIFLEIIDIQAFPELAEKYQAFATPTTYANEKLIAQETQTEELFMASLMKLEQQTLFIPDNDAEQIETDLLIIGGGPAGLTAGIYSARSGLKTVIVEKGTLGGQIATTPVVENYPGFTHVGGKSLVDILISHALEYSTIFPGEEVMDINPGQPLVVITSRRRFLTRAVLLATGAVYRHLGVPGEDSFFGRGISYCGTCDGPLFRGRKVLIVGGGDSAVTEALHLHNIGVEVTLMHRGDALRAQSHLVQSLSTNKMPVLFNTEIREIRGEDRLREVLLFNNRTGETKTAEVEGIFIAIGYDPNVALARRLGIELTGEGYIKKDSRHRTNIPGIYSAGDVEGGFKQIVIAAGQGAEAALAIFEDLVNPYWVSKPGSAAQAATS